MSKPVNAREQAQAARAAGRVLVRLSSDDRSAVLNAVAAALVDRSEGILAANALDVQDASRSVAAGTLARALADRLRLSPEKLATLAEGVRAIAASAEPIGRVLRRTELAPGLVLRQETSPIGVLLVIFESRPDALPQIAALALRSGNGVILKGGHEAARSNAALHRVITDAVAPWLPPEVVGLVQTREHIADLLQLDDVIDLVIPRGSSALVRHIQQNTRIPVMGHAEGVCHVYVHASADADQAVDLVLDSKLDYPAACNAMETLLVDDAAWEAGLGASIAEALRARGVTLYAGPRLAERVDWPRAEDLHHEYGDLACAVELVPDVHAAITHIHQHGSGHTECIVATSPEAAEVFLDGVDSACVFHNASTRFADGYRFGLGAEVGISTGRIHARGPVGVRGLLTTRWKLQGNGDTVAPFSRGERRFTHRPL